MEAYIKPSQHQYKVHRHTSKHYWLFWHFVISSKFSYTDFGIGDVVACTTPVSTLRELYYHFHIVTDEDTAPSGRTFKIDDLHFISLAPSVGNDIFRFIFENIVSINPLHSDGTQSRFNSLGPVSSSPCSHHWRTHQAKPGNEATTPASPIGSIGREPVQG